MTTIFLATRDKRASGESPELEGKGPNLEVHSDAVALVRALHLATQQLTVILPPDDKGLCADIQGLVAADPEALGRHRFITPGA
jgi:hypothetical protein